MIPLTSLVTSLEISKRLKELGIKQESQFYWARWFNNGFPITEVWSRAYAIDGPGGYNGDKASAFTTGELGMMISDQWGYPYRTESSGWQYCKYVLDLEKWTEIGADNEADARGKLLIYLLENKLITIESVNHRLRGEYANA